MLRRLSRATIWSPGAIPKDEQKYAGPLKWVLFPLFNVAVMLVGIFGLMSGFQALQLTFPSPVPDVLYGVLAVAGVVALIGSGFPKLWVPEAVAKLVILFGLAVLFAAMLIAAAEIPGHSGLAVAPMIAVMMLVAFLKIWILTVEWVGRD